jgi:molybdate transport system ATP-binding protein
VQVQARDVSLALAAHDDSSILNRVAATVVEVAAAAHATHATHAAHAAHVLVRLDVSGTVLLARITRRSCDQLGVQPGQRLWAQIKSVALLA